MAELLKTGDKRTCYCAELSAKNIGQQVCVMGWVQRQRDLGQLIFIDLRDRSGIVQLAFDDKTEREIFTLASGVRSETVLLAKGVVRSRGAGAVNNNIPTGEIEVAVDCLRVLSRAETPPFDITEDSDVRSEVRLQHRYLDLRRPDLQRTIIGRSTITRIAREYYADNGFIDIETPCLIKPTPEGARNYLVPSRIHHGKFYALPQSPQLYKQLLMVSGFDRYFQIARCFRDEDLRADRQPEFTQIDVEMSFVTQDDVIAVTEGFLKKLFAEIKGVDIKIPFLRLTYKEAMERFGSDKPDMRFGFEIVDISDVASKSGFEVFSSAVAEGGSVRAINVKGGAIFSRKEIDSLALFAKSYRAKGVIWNKKSNGESSSSYAKKLNDKENDAIAELCGFEDGDLILIVADKNDEIVFNSLGALRIECAKRLGLLKSDDYKFLWVTDFPLFEYSEEEGRYLAKHHPFTMPNAEDIDMIETNPGKVRAIAYDIVLNGTELGGGSIRIHDSVIQERMFKALGFTEKDSNEKFGFLLEAFRYGVPPHGGMAFGLDRLVMKVFGVEDIKDVIAFPKIQNATEPMSKCPGFTDVKALSELGISITDTEKE